VLCGCCRGFEDSTKRLERDAARRRESVMDALDNAPVIKGIVERRYNVHLSDRWYVPNRLLGVECRYL
jgi:hypothetical protein